MLVWINSRTTVENLIKDNDPRKVISMKQNIYREASLKRLSSPEQLDQLIRVTSPMAWLTLAAIGLLLASAIVWSFTGSIATKIEGQGILLNNAGVYSIKSHSTGQVTDVRFKNGDLVKKGDVIARIEQPELVEKINNLLDSLHAMEENQQLASMEYRTMLSQVEQLREELEYCSQIVSPIEGRVLKLNFNQGSVVVQGENLLTLEQYDATVRLEAVIYVAVELGGKIRPGMEAQINPSLANKEEYGFMKGRVISVAEYPETTQSMLQTLGNENLVNLLEDHGALVQVKIDLTPDTSTASGYQWSSPSGPPYSIPNGTLVQGAVVIAREKPVEKVIPSLESVVQKSGEE